jgi:hypothetical protein
MLMQFMIGVALERPPKTDAFVFVNVEAATEIEGELIACQMAACISTMPVSSELIDIMEI